MTRVWSNLHGRVKLIVPLAFPRCSSALMQLRLSRASLMHCGNSQHNSVLSATISLSWSQSRWVSFCHSIFLGTCPSSLQDIMESLPWAVTHSCCLWTDCLLSMIKFSSVNGMRWTEMHTNIKFYFKPCVNNIYKVSLTCWSLFPWLNFISPTMLFNFLQIVLLVRFSSCFISS